MSRPVQRRPVPVPVPTADGAVRAVLDRTALDAVLHAEPRCGRMLPQERPALFATA